MTGKDVWRWILLKFDNDLIHQIYGKKKVVCKGFRTKTIQDISTNRNRLINNLLNKDNYKKLVMWAAETSPTSLDDLTLADKELNELVDVATEKGVVNVLIKLFCESQERKAVQLFSFLQDENSSLLKISNQAFTLLEEDSSLTAIKNETNGSKETDETIATKETVAKKQGEETTKSENKKIQKLTKKIENLTAEMEKRDANNKAKMEDLERNHQQTLKKLNDKNQLYGILLKEKENLEIIYQEVKKEWKKEIDERDEKILRLEEELNRLNERLKEHEAIGEETEMKRVLVIGKPVNTTHFQSEIVDYSFLEGSDVHDYEFADKYDAYWVLSYDLSHREQLLLRVNETFSNLDTKKVFICKDFNEVRRQIRNYSRQEERVPTHVRK